VGQSKISLGGRDGEKVKNHWITESQSCITRCVELRQMWQGHRYCC